MFGKVRMGCDLGCLVCDECCIVFCEIIVFDYIGLVVVRLLVKRYCGWFVFGFVLMIKFVFVYEIDFWFFFSVVMLIGVVFCLYLYYVVVRILLLNWDWGEDIIWLRFVIGFLVGWLLVFVGFYFGMVYYGIGSVLVVGVVFCCGVVVYVDWVCGLV